MEAQYFVYTRGHDIANDYKLLFSPSEDFCPSEVRGYFLKQVRGLINLDTYIGDLEENPRWILSKRKGYTLWGVGTMNKKLSNINNMDYANRAVRGFFGIIIKGYPVPAIPFDLSFFEQFYSKYIVDLWNAPKESFKKKGITSEVNFDKYATLPLNTCDLLLNKDENKTVIWEDSISPEDFFSAALNSNGDFSCVYGLEEKNHAFNHDYKYCNVIIKGVKNKEEKTYKIEEPKEEEYIGYSKTVEDISSKPKKVFGLKLLTLGIIATFVVLTFTIVRCCKSNQTNPQKSVSGDSIQTIKTTNKN